MSTTRKPSSRRNGDGDDCTHVQVFGGDSGALPWGCGCRTRDALGRIDKPQLPVVVNITSHDPTSGRKLLPLVLALLQRVLPRRPVEKYC